MVDMVDIFVDTESCDTADRIDGHLFVLGHQNIGCESAGLMEKSLAMRHGCVCSQGFKMGV